MVQQKILALFVVIGIILLNGCAIYPSNNANNAAVTTLNNNMIDKKTNAVNLDEPFALYEGDSATIDDVTIEFTSMFWPTPEQQELDGPYMPSANIKFTSGTNTATYSFMRTLREKYVFQGYQVNLVTTDFNAQTPNLTLKITKVTATN